MPWFDNTLFVLTADHSCDREAAFYKTEHGAYRVPILFYKQGQIWPDSIWGKTCQHPDIYYSVLDFIGYDLEANNVQLPLFGNSIFSKERKNSAIMY